METVMKNLEELRKNFVEARALAKAGDPKTVKAAATKLYEIYKHCCEYHEIPGLSIVERSQALVLSTKIEEVIRLMLANGYQDETVAEFFGLAVTKKTKAQAPAPVKSVPPVKKTAPDPVSADKKSAYDLSIDLASMLGDKSARASSKPAAPTPVKTAPAAPIEVPVSDAGSGNWGADMFERYLPATVVITTESACGTGFFISENGYILTNHHVAYNGSKKSQYIHVVSGDERCSGNATLIAADQAADVAILQLQNQKRATPFIPIIEEYARVRPGDDVMIIGNAMNAGLAPVIGSVKFTNKGAGKFDIVYSAQTNGGDSGSPLIDRQGRCIGIHKAREGDDGSARSIRGIAYATTAKKIKELLSKWKDEYRLDL